MEQVYKLYQNKLSLNSEQHIDKKFFEKCKVTYNNAVKDAEAGLIFDPPVYLQRYSAVQDILLNEKWREKIIKVVDFGCAELKFFTYLKHLTSIQEILLVDIDEELLRSHAFRIQPFSADYLSRRRKPLHVEVIQGSVDSPDPKLISVDAVICIEIIEHLYPDTLDALPHNIFHFIQPRIALFTTPNADFNELFPNFSGIRHYDHKFEWSRQQFEDWAYNIILRYPNYSVYFVGIGPGPKGKEHLGSCSQMAIFIKTETEEDETRKNLVEALCQIDSMPMGDFSLKDCIRDLIDISDFISFGVCTYQSYVSNLLPSKRYNIICEVNHPFEVDHRTDEEVILHETEYRLHRLASFRKYQDYESDDIFIPLYELTSNNGGEFISPLELRTILQKGGWKIEDHVVDGIQTLCVVYEISPSSTSSVRSPSPNANFSTEANWDSGSQWDLESTENWDENIPNMDSNTTESTNDVWETLLEAQKSNEALGDNSISDPCVSGEQVGHGSEEKVELLFDSGYQVSSSSIELSPDLSKDWLSDEKKEETAKVKSDLENIRNTNSEKQCKPDDDYQGTMKSEAFIYKSRKRNKLKEEPQPNRAPIVVPPIIPAEIEIPVVENGDLANNNRDLEGNNYQAAENHEIQNDNAVPRVENLDEHNENHIMIDHFIEPNIEDDEDAAESLEDASREVLFDPNSEFNLSDDAFLVQGYGVTMSFDDYNVPITDRLPQQPRANSEDTFRSSVGFPIWLLHMLNINRDEMLDIEDESAHFYSQGDGLGVHPSTTEVSDDSSSSTGSTDMTNPNTTAVPSTASAGSSAELNFEDALDFETNASSSTIIQQGQNQVQGHNRGCVQIAQSATDNIPSTSSDTDQ